MEKKHIAAVFLKNKGKVLILKRSNSVAHYKNVWSGIAGYVERWETADETALKEIEEVGISKKDVKLVRKGVVETKDKDINIHWIGHVYLYESKKKKIKLDWEHTDYRWINPKDIKRYKTYPGVPKILKF